MNMLNQDGFIFELVTFGSQIELMILVLVDLLGLSVFSEKSSENSLSSHPKNFGGHSGFTGTSSFTGTGVSTSSLFFQVSSGSGARVHNLGLFHDKTILD
jgi:hypothetical protein